MEPETIGYMAFENGANSSIEVPSDLAMKTWTCCKGPWYGKNPLGTMHRAENVGCQANSMPVQEGLGDT